MKVYIFLQTIKCRSKNSNLQLFTYFYLKFVKTETKHRFNVSEIQYSRFVDTIYFLSKSFACCEERQEKE